MIAGNLEIRKEGTPENPGEGIWPLPQIRCPATGCNYREMVPPFFRRNVTDAVFVKEAVRYFTMATTAFHMFHVKVLHSPGPRPIIQGLGKPKICGVAGVRLPATTSSIDMQPSYIMSW